jgi:hypothetical protein
VTQEINGETFMVWASDRMVYGPLALDALIQWTNEGRVEPETWVLAQRHEQWSKAKDIGALSSVFLARAGNPSTVQAQEFGHGILAAELRHFPIFSALSDQQVQQFIKFGELVEAPAGRLVLRKQDPSDSIFFVLAGQLRARVMVGHEEQTLGRVKAGECFGEAAMFQRTLRTADVVVESDARMLRVTSEAFVSLITQHPQIAAPMLFGMASVMSARLSERNQKSERQVASQLVWR